MQATVDGGWISSPSALWSDLPGNLSSQYWDDVLCRRHADPVHGVLARPRRRKKAATSDCAEGAGRSGVARVGLINQAVDVAITPASDEMQWGRRGNCEDYAIVKYVALLQAGLSHDDVKIVILRNLLRKEDHAAEAARVDGQWLILDTTAASRWCAIRRWSDPSQNSCSMRTARGASSRQIEPGRGQVPADRARPVSPDLLSPRRGAQSESISRQGQ